MINKFTPAEKYVGRWVKALSNDLGFGRCVERRDDGVLVRYVDIPDVAEELALLSFGDVQLARFSLGTRVWLRRSEFGWSPGIVSGWAGADEYRVRFVTEQVERKYSGASLVVRWNRPLRDPAAALAEGMADSPEFYQARSGFFDELLQQRRVSRGFSGLISAPVRLYRHQVDTVTRVLGDPVMRYLLADEVGLGKTIEAGLIVRQFLLDEADACVAVVVPRFLQAQWHGELVERLLLADEFKRRRLRLLTYDEALKDALPREVNLVVVDEAHRLLPLLKLRPFLQTQISRAKNLLLLSATPMRGDLELFQGLLNLVDGTAFPLGDLQGFARRVEQREREASALDVLLSARAPDGTRLRVSREMGSLHPGDARVQKLVEDCENAANSSDPCWAELASYLRETYRLSRRMIRHRRNVGPAQGYPVSGRAAVRVRLRDPARGIVDDFLDRYLEEVGRRASPAQVLEVVDAGLAGPPTMLRFLDLWLTEPRHSPRFAPAELRPLISAAADRLRYMSSSARCDAALAVARTYVARGDRVVVIASTTGLAREFLATAQAARVQIHAHTTDMEPGRVEQELRSFFDARQGALLVGDHSLEEGRNLQAAAALVNLDLPLDFNRLEQRIGRLDRFATRGGPAEVVVFEESDSEWVSGHLTMLSEGVGILAASVATLQRKLSEVLERLAIDLMNEGVRAFAADFAKMRAEFQYEQEEIDLLEEIESVSAVSEFGDDALAELEEYDVDVEPLAVAFQRLSARGGGIGLVSRPGRRPGTLTFDRDMSNQALSICEDDFQNLQPHLGSPRTFMREVAVVESGVSPLRIGDPLVDWLDSFLRNDERGRSRAWIRPLDGLRVPQLWLACDFLVEFDSVYLDENLRPQARRLRRRGDALFAPIMLRTWTDHAGAAPEKFASEHLRRPFDGERDLPIRGSAWGSVLDRLPDWRTLCTLSAEMAREIVIESRVVAEAKHAASVATRRESLRRLAVLEVRALRLPSAAEREGAQHEMEQEAALTDALLRGVDAPAVTQVAAGALVLWPRTR